MCVLCGVKGHRVKDNKCTTRRPRCYHCKLDHPASYKGCTKYKQEKEALRLKNQNRTSIHYARKTVAEEQRTRRQQPQPSPITAGAASYANSLRMESTRGKSTRPPSQVVAPVEGRRWGPRARRGIPQSRRYNETDSRSERGSDRDQAETEEEQHSNTKRQKRNSTKKEIGKTIEGILEKNLPNILGTILMKFAEIIINIMQQKGNDTTKLETVRNNTLKMITDLFPEQRDEDHMSQASDNMENRKKAASRGRSRTRNPDKDRQRWRSRV